MSQDEEQKCQIQCLAGNIYKLCNALIYEIRCKFELPELSSSLIEQKRDLIIEKITEKISALNQIIMNPIRDSHTQKPMASSTQSKLEAGTATYIKLTINYKIIQSQHRILDY